MKVQLHNADIGDLYVTVQDLNTQNQNTVFSDRLNIDESKDIDVREDGDGKGAVKWNASRTDDAQQAASGTQTDLYDLATVNITTSK